MPQDLFSITKGGFPFDRGPSTYESRLRGDRKKIVASISEKIRWSYSNLRGRIDFYLMPRDDVTFVNYENRPPLPQTPVFNILDALSDR